MESVHGQTQSQSKAQVFSERVQAQSTTASSYVLSEKQGSAASQLSQTSS